MIDTQARDEQQRLFPLETTERSESLTLEETARLLGYHRRTVQKKLQEGDLTRAPDGGVDPGSVNRYREQRLQAQRATGQRPQEQSKALAIAQVQVTLLREEVAWLKAELKSYKEQNTDLIATVKAHTQRPDPPRQHHLPTPGTLLDRVYQFLRASPRPRNARQVQQALGLPKPPGRELARLVTEWQLARRIRPGLFEALGPRKKATTAPPTPLLYERVFRVVAEADHPLTAAEVQARLQSPRRVNQELSRLVDHYKKLCHIKQADSRFYVYIVRKEKQGV